MNILVKSAKIIDSSLKSLHLKKRDILIKNGIVHKIAAKIEAPAKTRIIDIKGLCVSVGWFDSSVSFGEPGYEERETIANGLKVAAQSGFTDIVLNPNTFPVPDNSATVVFLKNAAKNSVSRLHPLGTLTLKAEGKDLAELYDMQNAGAVGFYDHKKSIDNSNLLKIALQYSQSFDGLVHSFPIDTKISGKGMVHEGIASTKLGLKGIPPLAEELQIARDLFILEYTGGKLHIPTISTANSVKLIATAKKKGLDVSCSVPVHNLWFTDDVLSEFDTNYKVMPPLRSRKDISALIKGVENGTIDFVTSDHTPIDIEQKRVEFDNAAYGAIGLESTFGVLNQIFGMVKAVELLTQGRERYQLKVPKIKEGERACFTLFNAEEEFMLSRENSSSTSLNTMYHGKKMKGMVYGVICNDQILI
ncbi:dihydroorotase [Spongiimicrobium salis]|uniref:dihydroorotase n=1 Tax=Spongiimicrobium salis TaxID=1667022 RepID=UPI00374CC3F2